MTNRSMRYAKIVTFTVEGSGYFPVDMLRYDACYPAREEDSHATIFADDLRRVTLKHRVLKDEVLTGFPCEGRWKSFTWRVVPGSIYYD